MMDIYLDEVVKAEASRTASLAIAPGQWFSVKLADGGHWYGHGFHHVPCYPLETGATLNESFAVNNIQSPAWMCSSGYVFFADTCDLLSVKIDGGDGCLNVMCPSAPWTLRVFKGKTLPEARKALMRHLGWPSRLPEASILGDSLFCTWTQYPRCITQERVLDMARQICAAHYPCTTLILDDRWEASFGELEFSKDFPDPRAMVRDLHALGFKVWLWVTPFVNQESSNFNELASKRILVPHRDGARAAMLKWWGGVAGLVDLSAPQGRAWYRDRLLYLKDKIGVDGFKIDGGDYKYQPPPDAADWHSPVSVSAYSDLLLSLFEEVAPMACESRTAWLSQSRAILWREGGKDSHWGLDNGLKAMVTLGQHLALLGYDLLIPDMIPGRVQTLKGDMPLPTDELMVRWTEATAFFPIMQFSYFPWNYERATAEACSGWARVHKALESYLVAQATRREAPLLRPLWYDDPGEPELYALADSFMLGADLLVAPVVEAGQTERDVLLPRGVWHDAWTGKAYEGGWIRKHPAPCPGIPLFVSARNMALLETLRGSLKSISRGSVPAGITSATYSCRLDRDLSVTG